MSKLRLAHSCAPPEKAGAVAELAAIRMLLKNAAPQPADLAHAHRRLATIAASLALIVTRERIQ